MALYGIIVGTYLVSVVVEARCMNRGNETGALAAQRFGRFFIIGAGLALSWQWVGGMIALLH